MHWRVVVEFESGRTPVVAGRDWRKDVGVGMNSMWGHLKLVVGMDELRD